MSEGYQSKIISEIIETEKSYLVQLEKLQNYFSKPSLEKGLLPSHAHSAIFSQLSAINQMNSRLLEEITDSEGNIGSAFLKLGPFLKVYSSYAKNFQRSLVLLQEWESKNEAFKSFISGAETRPEVQTKLTSLLIAPIQRIPRYRLLLQDLLKHSDSSFHSYKDIEGALKQVSEVAEHINKSVDDSQALSHLLVLQKALKNQQPSIIVPGRKLLKEGVLNKVSRKGNGSQARLFFLFSDMLMYTKLPTQNIGSNSKANLASPSDLELKANSLECCCVLPLRYCRVTTLFGSDDQGITFRLQCSDEDLLLYSSCCSEGQDWVGAIKAAALEALQKRKTLRKASSRKKAVRRTPLKKFVLSEDEASPAEAEPKAVRKSPRLGTELRSKKESFKSHLRTVRDCLTPPRTPKRQDKSKKKSHQPTLSPCKENLHEGEARTRPKPLLFPIEEPAKQISVQQRYPLHPPRPSSEPAFTSIFKSNQPTNEIQRDPNLLRTSNRSMQHFTRSSSVASDQAPNTENDCDRATKPPPRSPSPLDPFRRSTRSLRRSPPKKRGPLTPNTSKRNSPLNLSLRTPPPISPLATCSWEQGSSPRNSSSFVFRSGVRGREGSQLTPSPSTITPNPKCRKRPISDFLSPWGKAKESKNE